jgi:hypothetical protein
MPRCQHHKTKFKAKYFNQKFCLSDDECIKAFNESVKANQQKQKAKDWQKEKKEIKEKLMTKSDYEKLLQKEINTIVRLIDKNSFCHSTKKPLNDKFDAGHFYSVGSNPTIRFNLFNIYAQSVYANQYLSGDQINFLAVLSDVYGLEHKEYVLSLKSRYNLIKLSQNDLKDKIQISRSIVKHLQLENKTYNESERLELRKKFNAMIGIYV